MYFLPTSSSRFQPVSRQNSVPTKQISPVRRQTTVGVPENEMSLLSSTSVRWNVRSTKVCSLVNESAREEREGGADRGRRRTSSSSVSGICKAIRLGRKVASARMIRKMSFLSNLSASREVSGHFSKKGLTRLARRLTFL